jgi:NADH-quinone oxidoreductase subunit L
VGFFSKDAVLGVVLDAALHEGSWTDWLLLVSAALTVLVTAAYALRAWLMVCFGAPAIRRSAETGDGAAAARGTAVEHGRHEPPWPMRAPVLVLAVATAFGGLLLLSPRLLVDPRDPDTEFVHPEVAVTATVAVLLVLALVYAAWRSSGRVDPSLLLGRRVRGALAREAGFDPLYGRVVVSPTRWLAGGAVAGDRDVVEPYVRGGALTARLLGGVLRLAQNGNVQVYLGVVVLGALVVAAVIAAAVGAGAS